MFIILWLNAIEELNFKKPWNTCLFSFNEEFVCEFHVFAIWQKKKKKEKKDIYRFSSPQEMNFEMCWNNRVCLFLMRSWYSEFHVSNFSNSLGGFDIL